MYVALDAAWSAGRLSNARTILDEHRDEFGHLPTAKLAEARQLAFGARVPGADRANREARAAAAAGRDAYAEVHQAVRDEGVHLRDAHPWPRSSSTTTSIPHG